MFEQSPDYGAGSGQARSEVHIDFYIHTTMRLGGTADQIIRIPSSPISYSCEPTLPL